MRGRKERGPREARRRQGEGLKGKVTQEEAGGRERDGGSKTTCKISIIR